MYAPPQNKLHRTAFYGLTELQLKILVNFIQHCHPEQLSIDITAKLMEFVHLGHSVVGMYNYVIWALSVEQAASLIIETVDHDLAEMHTRLFVARTHEYENMEVPHD